MKGFQLVLIPPLSLALLYLVNGAISGGESSNKGKSAISGGESSNKGKSAISGGESSNKGKEVSTSQDDQETCHCGDYLLNQFQESVSVGRIELSYITDPIGSGHFSKVYHANWIKGKQCVALKKYTSNSYERELEAFIYFDSIAEEKTSHIIKMHGFEKIGNKLFMVLELGGKVLRNYFYERIGSNNIGRVKQKYTGYREKILLRIIRGAARALEQFHKLGGHYDIKHDNFVISREHDPNAEIIDVKLIDFNISRLYKNDLHNEVGEIQKDDIKNFGIMVFRMLYEYYPTRSDPKTVRLDDYSTYDHNSKLDRVIKACFQNENLPSMYEIVKFLNGKIENFRLNLEQHADEQIVYEEGIVNEHGRTEQHHNFPEHRQPAHEHGSPSNARLEKKKKKKGSRFLGCIGC